MYSLGIGIGIFRIRGRWRCTAVRSSVGSMPKVAISCAGPAYRPPHHPVANGIQLFHAYMWWLYASILLAFCMSWCLVFKRSDASMFVVLMLRCFDVTYDTYMFRHFLFFDIWYFHDFIFFLRECEPRILAGNMKLLPPLCTCRCFTAVICWCLGISNFDISMFWKLNIIMFGCFDVSTFCTIIPKHNVSLEFDRVSINNRSSFSTFFMCWCTDGFDVLIFWCFYGCIPGMRAMDPYGEEEASRTAMCLSTIHSSPAMPGLQWGKEKRALLPTWLQELCSTRWYFKRAWVKGWMFWLDCSIARKRYREGLMY